MTADPAGVLRRHNVQVAGAGAVPMMFAHGFGCDQTMWQHVAPGFADDHRTVLFDNMGAGGSDASAYDRDKYGTLGGYADDVIEICRALDLRGAVFVGHSISAMIGVLAAIRAPECFSRLVLIAPSPRYIHDDGYVGAFSAADIEGLLGLLDSNFMAWSSMLAPVIMANPDRPALAGALRDSFCRTDPGIARQFARVTFLSDNRSDLPRLQTPSLILQCEEDAIAPVSVGEYLHHHLQHSRLVRLRATGHCPHVSAPGETAAAIRDYLRTQGVSMHGPC